MPKSREPKPFWHWVRKTDGCWLWTGYIEKTGYAKYRRNTFAHRESWEIANNKPIPWGYDVHHLCGNKGCVNPDHLVCISAWEHHHKSRRERIIERSKYA